VKLIYRPEDGPAEEYDFEPAKLMSAEAEAVEDLKGAPWDSFEEFGALFLKGNARAHRAALWVMKRRKEPGLDFADLSYPLGALKITFTDDESARFVESIRANPDLDDTQKDYLIKTLDLAVYEGQMKDGTDLKDPSPSSAADGSTSAPLDSVPG
jgi:hypothetical protein